MAHAAFQTASQDNSDIRIYVACLAACNNGILHGRWINADQDADDIRSEIAAMLKASPIEDAEEYAIHDYEGFEGVSLSEYHGIDEVSAMAAFIAEHGELGAEPKAGHGKNPLSLIARWHCSKRHALKNLDKSIKYL
jgi:antirestriction protein